MNWKGRGFTGWPQVEWQVPGEQTAPIPGSWRGGVGVDEKTGFYGK